MCSSKATEKVPPHAAKEDAGLIMDLELNGKVAIVGGASKGLARVLGGAAASSRKYQSKAYFRQVH